MSGRPLVRIVLVALAVGFGLRSPVYGFIGQVGVEIGGVNSRGGSFSLQEPFATLVAP